MHFLYCRTTSGTGQQPCSSSLFQLLRVIFVRWTVAVSRPIPCAEQTTPPTGLSASCSRRHAVPTAMKSPSPLSHFSTGGSAWKVSQLMLFS